MALLILSKGWHRVSGQKQMCHCVSAIVLKNMRWAKNKKHQVGMSACSSEIQWRRIGFSVLSVFLFSVLSQWFTFYFGSVGCLFTLGGNGTIIGTFLPLLFHTAM